MPVTRAYAQPSSPFHSLPYGEKRQYVVHCAAGFECDVQLEAGERVNDGFNAHIGEWDPHIGYSGADKVTPHLILRPSVSNLRTNIILTTTKRTYYILAISTSRGEPSYYSFTYEDETFRELNRISLATEAARRGEGDVPIPAVTATPVDVARLGSTCFDYDYSYAIDRSLQPDRPPRARPSKEVLPANLVPRLVCTDGQHTFIEFPRQQEVPSDLPISLAVTSEGDTLIDYTYVASLNRFTIDGVYDSFALEVGSQDQPLRIRIYHANRGNPPANVIRIRPPADLELIDKPVTPEQSPLITIQATSAPVRQLHLYEPTPTSMPTPTATVAPISYAVPAPQKTDVESAALSAVPGNGLIVSLIVDMDRPVSKPSPLQRSFLAMLSLDGLRTSPTVNTKGKN